MTDETLVMDLTEDAFLGERLLLRQPRTGYRAGVDAVLLAATVSAQHVSPLHVLDCGAGAGTVGLCVAARVPNARITLVERDPRLVLLATGNIARNGLSGRVDVAAGDITAKATAPPAPRIPDDAFDAVLANPPFHDADSGTLSQDDLKSASHAMPVDELDQWVRFMARTAKPGGTATMIHKADALPRILAAMDARFGSLTVVPVCPRAGAAAIRVIVRGVKGSRAPLTLLPGFVLHGDGHAFTPEAAAILRDGAALTI
jgi:tRNA1(Val) A37 N6-methylase TrmN6